MNNNKKGLFYVVQYIGERFKHVWQMTQTMVWMGLSLISLIIVMAREIFLYNEIFL